MGTHTTKKPFNILSFDGGGVRGILEACLLERIESKHPNILRDADLLVGTSTGGIIALGLAAGKSPAALREMYQTASKEIFSETFFGRFKDFWNLLGADYKSDNLRKMLEIQFGDLLLGDLEKRVAITTFDLDNEAEGSARAWKAKIFHNCRGSDADLDVRVVDLALRTSAAPTYFPTSDGYIDGGVFANNPSMVGLAQALNPRNLNKDLRNINLLSLGAGRFRQHIDGDNLNWGLAKWAKHLLGILMDGSVDVVDFECKQILRDKYYRLNPQLTHDYPLDDWKNILDLMAGAQDTDIAPVIDWLEKNWK